MPHFQPSNFGPLFFSPLGRSVIYFGILMKFPQQRFHDDISHYVADSLVLWTQHNVSPNEAAWRLFGILIDVDASRLPRFFVTLRCLLAYKIDYMYVHDLLLCLCHLLLFSRSYILPLCYLLFYTTSNLPGRRVDLTKIISEVGF